VNATAQLLPTELTCSGRYPRPERRRPAPRKPGWKAALEVLECQDRIFAAVTAEWPEVSMHDASTAVELALRCASTWAKLARDCGRAGWRPYLYRLSTGDREWLNAAQDHCRGYEPDLDVVLRMEEELERIPIDAAMLGSLRAAQEVLHRCGFHCYH
jgi:hypothetical protein